VASNRIIGKEGRRLKTYGRYACAVFRGRGREPDKSPFRELAPGTRLPLKINGHFIRNTWALFNACRFPHLPELQQRLMSPGSTGLATEHEGESRADWNDVQMQVMEWCLRVKLASNYPKFSALLRSTAGKYIVWEPRHRDRFWGATAVGKSLRLLRGDNHLGRLLMKLRAEVEAGTEREFLVVQPPEVDGFLLFGKPVAQVPERPIPRTPPDPHDLPWDGPKDLARAAEAILGDKPVDVTTKRFHSLLELAVDHLEASACKLRKGDAVWTTEDLIMEPIAVLLERFPGIREPEKLPGWLTRIQKNKLLSAQKKRTDKSEVRDPMPDMGVLLDSLRDQMAARIAMDRLRTKRPRLARALELAEVEELSGKEAGEELGLSENAFYALKRRALAKFRTYFEKARKNLSLSRYNPPPANSTP